MSNQPSRTNDWMMGPPELPKIIDSPSRYWSNSNKFTTSNVSNLSDYSMGQAADQIPHVAVDENTVLGFLEAKDGPWVPPGIQRSSAANVANFQIAAFNEYRSHSEAGSIDNGFHLSDSGYKSSISVFSADQNESNQDCNSLSGTLDQFSMLPITEDSTPPQARQGPNKRQNTSQLDPLRSGNQLKSTDYDHKTEKTGDSKSKGLRFGCPEPNCNAAFSCNSLLKCAYSIFV
jgi:hypothetical protein